MASAQTKFDTLDYADELEKAGVPEAQAKVQAKALFRIIDQQLVSKQDIKELEVKIKELEVKLSHDNKMIQLEIKSMESRLINRMGGIVGVSVGLGVATLGGLIGFFH